MAPSYLFISRFLHKQHELFTKTWLSSIFLDLFYTPSCYVFYWTPFFFSESDVALIIKYNFHDSQNQIESEDKSKKRKLNPVKAHSVIDYSSVKLPAPMFAYYLDSDCQSFMHDCLR